MTRNRNISINIKSQLSQIDFSIIKQDIIAGIIAAAITIPLSMGYAEIAGIDAIYGLYAAFISAIVFSILSKNKTIIFGMDSATAAVTGTAIASISANQSASATEVMPFLALLTSVFVMIFGLLKVGNYLNMIPIPVMDGFIVGVSITVIINQIPKLIGIPSITGTIADKITAIISSISTISTPVMVMSFISIVLILIFVKKFPHKPLVLLVLILDVILSYICVNYYHITINCIGLIQESIPPIVLPHMPSGSFLDMANIALDALVIAVVLSIETILCVKSTTKHSHWNYNKELSVSSIANTAGAFFACPPSAASLSRTATLKNLGAKTKLAPIASAITVMTVIMFFNFILEFIPLFALSSIVVAAMIQLPNYKRISKYAQHMKVDFMLMILVAIIVIVLGAIYGVLFGVVISFILLSARKHGISTRKAIFGLVDTDLKNEYSKYCNLIAPDKIEEITKCVKMSFGTRMSFSDVQNRICKAKEILKDIPIEIPLLLGLTKLNIIDFSACKELIDLIKEEQAKGRKVYCIRKLSLANDSYTRYELRSIMYTSDGNFHQERYLKKNNFDMH